MKYTCGIDWAQGHHDISIVNESGMEVKKLRITDDLNGYRKLLRELEQRGQNIPVAIECKEHLVIRFLVGKGYPVYPINPKSADRYKDRYIVSRMKTDEIDAFALADILRTDIHKHKPIAYSSRQMQKLQILCWEYEKLLKDKNLLEAQLQDVLTRYYPVVLTLFSSNSCKILFRFILHYPTYKKLRKASFQQFSRFMRKNRYLLPKYIERMYQKIQTSEYSHDPVFDATFSHTAVALCKAILLFETHIEKLVKQMTQIKDRHRLGAIFDSLPGSGKIMSVKLLALMGDNKTAYTDASEVQAYAGIAPMIKSSGKKFRTVFRFSCNKDFRDILTWFAFCSMNYCPWARAFYDRKKAEGKGHFAACRLLAFKWLRIIFVLWKREELYDERLHLQNVAKYQQQGLKTA